MPTPLETIAERRTVRWAHSRGIVTTKMNFWGQRHWPDQCFWIPGGKPLLIEFKRKGEEPTRAQASLHVKLRRLDYDVYAYDNFDGAVSAIRCALEGARVSKTRR